MKTEHGEKWLTSAFKFAILFMRQTRFANQPSALDENHRKLYRC